MTTRFGSRPAWLILSAVFVAAGRNGFAQAPGTIITVAGTGLEGYAGDGGPATAAQLRPPCCVAVDSAGNLFIGDAANHRVRKVSPSGVISTVAGTGERGYSGDGGPATAARLSYPGCVVLDSTGNLFITDADNHRIRKVSPSGIISTVAGTDKPGFSGDGGAATSALLAYPEDVAMDSAGNLFIADTGNHRIRKVGPDGIVSTVAGTGKSGYDGDGGAAAAALLSYPSRLAVDSRGNLFIADTGNHRIRKVSSSGIMSTVAGTGKPGYGGDNGPAFSAQLNNPFGLAVDSAGNLLIADTGNSRIRKISPDGKISTVAGTDSRGYGGDGQAATLARLNTPFGIAVDYAGSLFIADTTNARVRKVSGSGDAVCTLLCSASVPTSALPKEQIPFFATAIPQGCTGVVSYDWSFGDGDRSPLQNPTHAYAGPGSYTWTMTASVGAGTCSRSGAIIITAPNTATRVRIRALDEARTPTHVSTFPGQTLYWHYALEADGGAAVSATAVSIAVSPLGFSPSPEAFAFQMEEPGHLVVKAEVDALNAPPSCSGCSFSFRPGVDSVTLDGQPYELTEAPPAVRLSISDPPIVDAWDVFGELSAGATGCLGLCGQTEAASVSVAVARLAGSLPSGVTLRLGQDRRQLHQAGRGISLRRRFSLSQGARLRVPLFDSRTSSMADVSVPVGASTGGGYGFTGSQTLSYGGGSEKEAKLVHAAFLLESLSLAGLPLPPVASPVLTATLDSLNGTPGLLPASRKECMAGTTLEGKLSPDVGYPGLWGSFAPRLVPGGMMTGVLEQEVGAVLGPDFREPNYVGRVRWADEAGGETGESFGDVGRFGSTVASLLSGARVFEYGHEARVSPSLELLAFETALGTTQAQTRLDLADYTDQSLRTRTVKYRFGQRGVAEAIREAIPTVAALSSQAELAALGVVSAAAQSLPVETLSQTAERIEQMRKAAQEATQAVTYSVASDVASLRKAAAEATVNITFPGTGESIDLTFPLVMLRERKATEVSRSVDLQGREWKLSEWSGYPDDALMPDLPDLLRDAIFTGLGPWIEDAWQRRVTSLTAVVPQMGLTALEVRNRVTRKLVASVIAPAGHAGRTIRILSYSADRPEATGTNAQGVATAAQWRYTTTRIVGKSPPPGPQFSPPPSNYLMVGGDVVDLTVLENQGTGLVPLPIFQPPLTVEFPLDPARLARYGIAASEVARMRLYRYDLGTREWSAVAASLVLNGQVLLTQLTQPGVYAQGLEIAPPLEDSDRDGLPASQEDLNGNGVLDPGETHPYVWDTDGDGVPDGEERRLGTDPTSAASHLNRAPVLGFIGNHQVMVGSTLEIQLPAHDADGQPVTFSTSTLPPGAELDAQSGRFRWTPTAAGEYPVEFRVSDGSLSDAESVLLTAYTDASPGSSSHSDCSWIRPQPAESPSAHAATRKPAPAVTR